MKPDLIRAALSVERAPLLDPTTELNEILAGLAARMDCSQRDAFFAKMVLMDREREGHLAVMATLGSA